LQAFDLSYLSKVYLFVVNETETDELTNMMVKTNSDAELLPKNY